VNVRPRLSLAAGRGRILALLAVLVAAIAALGGAAWVASPSPASLGAEVGMRLGGTGGSAIPLAQMPPILREAVVATEDERYYRHHGTDLIGVIRALPYDLTHLSFAEGASTITEQLAKVLYLGGNDHNPWRKLEDAAVAVKLENRYSKAQILAAYLNTAYLGGGAVGVQAAAERYFAIPARKLDPAQATLLAGLIQAPSLYDPLRDPALARARQIEVLRSLVRSKFMAGPTAAAVLARPLRLSNGTSLPPVTGIDLSPGPAFVWWQLALGATVMLLAALALVGTRTRRLDGRRTLVLIRVLLTVALLIGAAAVARSFRTA
jgi:membrane peptidoglycan carboxypeptidase